MAGEIGPECPKADECQIWGDRVLQGLSAQGKGTACVLWVVGGCAVSGQGRT